MIKHGCTTLALASMVGLYGTSWPSLLHGQDRLLRVFVSVDMEGIGGIGTPKMTGSSG